MKAIEKIENGILGLTDKEILELLKIKNNSSEFYSLLYASTN